VAGRRVGRRRFPACAAGGEAADRDPSSPVPARCRDPMGPRLAAGDRTGQGRTARLLAVPGHRCLDRRPDDQGRTVLGLPTRAEPDRAQDPVGPARAGLCARHRDRTGLLRGHRDSRLRHTDLRLGKTAHLGRSDHQHRVRTDPLRTARDRAVPVRTALVRMVPVRMVPVRMVPVQMVPVRMVPVRTVPRRTGPLRSGRARSGRARRSPARTGPDAVLDPARPDRAVLRRRRGTAPASARPVRTQGLPVWVGRPPGPVAGHRNTSRRPGGRRTRPSAGHAGEQRGRPGEPTVRSG
jgi:hypothetical protein